MVFLALIGFVALIAQSRCAKSFSQPVQLDVGGAHLQEGPSNALSVFTTTWNMGELNGSNDSVVFNATLEQWLFPDKNKKPSQQCTDLFIIATQEQRIGASATFKTRSKNLQRNHDEWVKRVSSFLNETCNFGYTKLDNHIGATSLMVFSKQHSIQQVSSFTIRRGTFRSIANFLSVLPISLGVNKGFAVIQFKHPKVSTLLVAVAGHMAAHEGKAYARKREEDLKSLLKMLPHKNESTVFLAGDLNTRIAENKGEDYCRDVILRRTAASAASQETVQNRKNFRRMFHRFGKTSRPSYNPQVNDLSSSEIFDLCDELKRRVSGHLHGNGLLAKFEELDINFGPTYKLKLNGYEKIEYDLKRAPAWTDRVLVRLGDEVTLVKGTASYDSIEGVRGSDHLPVYLRAEYKFLPAPEREH